MWVKGIPADPVNDGGNGRPYELTRRAVFVGLAAAAAGGQAVAQSRPDRVDKAVAEFVEALKEAYGGSWNISIDPEARLAVFLGVD